MPAEPAVTTAGSAATSRPRTLWPVVLLAVSAGIVIAFQIGKMPAAIHTMQLDLGLSLVDAGWVLSVLFAVAAVIGAVTGVYADHFGVRRVAMGGLIVAGVGSLIGGLADTLLVLLLSRLLEGVGSVTVLVAAPALILRATQPQDMRLAMGMWGTFMPTGIAIMILLTPPLLGSVGWRGLWFVNAGLVWAFALLFWWGTTHTSDRNARAAGTQRQNPWREIAAVIRRPGPWLLALIFGVYAAAFLPITAFLPKYLIDIFKYDAAVAAVFVALIIWANALGNLIGGWLGHRGAPRWLLITIALVTMGITGWLIYRPGFSAELRLALAFAFSLVGGLLPASVFGSVTLHAPDKQRIAGVNGLILQFTNVGQMASPPLFAAIVAAGTWADGPWLIVAFCVSGIAFAIMLRALERRPGRPSKA